MTALRKLGSENFPATRKLPPVGTRCWSNRDDHFEDGSSSYLTLAASLIRHVYVGFRTLISTVAMTAVGRVLSVMRKI